MQSETKSRYQNSREHIRFAKILRKQSPLAERLLWNALTSVAKYTGIKFRRQHPLHPYVADFACVKAHLIVELDGPSHDSSQSYDAARDAALRQQGWTIMRVSNDEVCSNREGVALTVLQRARELLVKR